MWRKSIQWKKYSEARKFLKENLFFAIPALARALLDIRKSIVDLDGFDFVDITRIDSWKLIYFIERQIESCDALRMKLLEYHTTTKELVCKSAHVYFHFYRTS